jgi:hypothetical protein
VPGVVGNCDTELRAGLERVLGDGFPPRISASSGTDITRVRHGETPAWLLSIDVAAALAQYL